jgi:hypothetical protein
MRFLKNGKLVKDLESPVMLQVKTKCPAKYKLVDMETGEEYIGNEPDIITKTGFYWRKI